MYDLIIKGGSVIDGTGSPAIIADIGIKDGKIISVCDHLQSASRIIDATGLTVTPGFIDSHSHADKKILEYPEQIEKVEQGITTSVAGQCGGSAAPNIDGVHQTMGSFFSALDKMKLGANFACFIGHGTVRNLVIGNQNRKADQADLKCMQAIVREAFEQGAAGVSFGLFYAPGCYADKAEAIALARVAKEYNRPVSAHIRSESDQLIEATEEFIDIVRQSGCKGILSHHKATQRRNWRKVSTTLKMLRDAVDEGLDIYCDVYPYCASSTRFSQAFVPHTWRSGGTAALLDKIKDPVLYKENKAAFYNKNGRDFSWIRVNSCPVFPEFEGLTLDIIAQKLNMDPFDAAMKLIVDCEDQCNACFFSVNEEDLKKVMSWERAMICTDGGLGADSKKSHPRMVGSFPRAIGLYACRERVVSLCEMIRKMTSLPADVYRLEGKGVLKEGFDADICIFDSERIIDKADFNNSTQRAEGLCYVIVNGAVVAENSVFNGVKAGKVIIK